MTREEICNSMTVEDAVRVLKETNCYGTMDIAKSVIIKALEKGSILDKIEAEIEQAFLDDRAMQEHTVKKCLGIIDKYKIESEG